MLTHITATYKKNPYLKKFRKNMRHHPTSAEAAMSRLLHKCRVKFSGQAIFVDGQTKYIADFWLWEHKLVIECDGGYHVDIAKKDANRDADFLAAGIRTMRIQNDKVMVMNSGELMSLLAAFIS